LPNGLKRTIPVNLTDTTPVNLTATPTTTANTPVTITTSTPKTNGIAELSPATSKRIPSERGVNNFDTLDIAVLDTGISLTHPDLNVYRNISFIDGVTIGDDDQGHGSHVAGIAAAKDNSIGVRGVAPDARLWAIKVCDKNGECKISNQIKGIEYAIKHANEIDILNISLENPNSPALNSIINEAIKAGITVIAAAGN
jgi:subtilisin family serine protease